MEFSSFEAISFDCYGTLIDWERGILDALTPILRAHGADVPGDEHLLELFARFESEAEDGDFRSYRDVLSRVALGLGRELGIVPSKSERAVFAGSVAYWPPFDDSAAALRALGARYRLAVVSNVDDDLFSHSAAHLGVDFDEVVTAQQVRSYKPAHTHFHEVLDRLGIPRDRLLHVAQSLYHDIGPARELGIPCVWVNRRSGRKGGGATLAASATPDLVVTDLAKLASMAGVT